MRFRAMSIINSSSRVIPRGGERGDRDAVRSRAARSFEIETDSVNFTYASKTHSLGS